MFDYKSLFKEEEPEVKKPLVQEPEEEEEELEEEVETVDSKVDVDVNAVAEKIGATIVAAIKKNQKLSDKDTTNLRESYFSSRNGFKAINYPDLNNLQNLSKNDKVVTWFKAMMNKDRDPEANQVFKALIEGTDAQGGYLVPEEWRTEVFRLLPNFAVMRRLARVIPMSTDTMNLTTLTARPAAYWTAEYASKSTTSAEFGQVVLHPNDLVCLIPVTHQLIADANIDVVRFITELFAEAIAQAEDKAFFTGAGTTEPVGLRSASGVKTVSVGGALTFDEMISAFYKLPQRHRDSANAAWVASTKVIEILHKVKDSTTGRYIWLPAGMDDVTRRPIDTILGHPVYEQNDLPEDELIFGDFSFYAIGDRQSLTVETTTQGGDAWRRNAVEIKAVERVDGEAILGGAFVLMSSIQS